LAAAVKENLWPSAVDSYIDAERGVDVGVSGATDVALRIRLDDPVALKVIEKFPVPLYDLGCKLILHLVSFPQVLVEVW
jgi:hypothetical protein